MDFSRITDELFIGGTPRRSDYQVLRDLGVRLVINMRFDHRPAPDPGQPPLDVLWLRTFDSVFLPIPMQALHQGVAAALETIRAGGRVYSHCMAGRHRSVAMGAAILVALGHDVHQAMELIKARRPVADPYACHIRSRILRFASQVQE